MSDPMRQNTPLCDALTPTQRVFVQSRARGKTVTQAAKDADVARTTPSTHWDTEAINAAILEIQQQHLKDSALALAHLLPAAIAMLETSVSSGELGAIKEVFDRIWGKAPQRQEITGGDGEPLFKIYHATSEFNPDDA